MRTGSAVIVGAGIAGLTTALALAEVSVASTILEQATQLDAAGAGVQISPNASRILKRLDLLASIRGTALEPTAIHVRRARDGATLQRLPLTAAEAQWGAPYLLVHRADLQAALVAAVAANPAITLRLGVRLEPGAIDAASATVALPHGDELRGDVLVGADGLRSLVRGSVLPTAPALRYSGQTAWRATIPISDVPTSLRVPETALWLGPGLHLVHYPLRSGSVLNLVAIADGTRSPPRPPCEWSAPGASEVIAAAFRRWSPTARSLIEAVPAWRTWPLYDLPPLESWHRGRTTLVGDAAHAALPFLAQGAAQAIEDAAALAGAWSQAPDPATALRAYEAARRERTARVQRQSRQQGLIYHLAGPAALVRDAGMQVLGSRRTLARYDWLYADRAR